MHEKFIIIRLINPARISVSPENAKEIRTALALDTQPEIPNPSNWYKNNKRDMLQKINENLTLERDDFRYVFTKEYDVLSLFKIVRTNVANVLFFKIKEIEIEPVKSILLLQIGNEYKTF